MNSVKEGLIVVLTLICLVGISSAQVPNLVGNWTGPYAEFVNGIGYSDVVGGHFFMNITEQHDRIFSGFTLFNDGNEVETMRDIAGVISADGTEFSMAEKENGYSTGKIIGPDEIEITYLNDRDPINVAIDSFTRIS